MKCRHCGARNKSDAVFCRNCNAWILAEVNIEPRHSRPRKKQKFSGLFLPLLTVIALTGILLASLLFPWNSESPIHTDGTLSTPPATTQGEAPVQLSSDAFVYRVGDISRFSFMTKSEFYIDSTPVMELSHQYPYTALYVGMDGTAGATLQGRQLIYFHDGIVDQIAEDIDRFSLSASGDGIVYLDASGQLLHYVSGEYAFIFQYDPSEYAEFVISPDGKTVLYSVRSPSDDVTSYYIYNNGVSILLQTSGMDPLQLLGVTNSGEYGYFLLGSTELIIIDANSQITSLGKLTDLHLASSMSISSFTSSFLGRIGPYFNADMTQVLYHQLDGTYLSVDGQPGVQISSEWLTPIEPEMTATFDGRSYSQIYPHKDFREKLFQAQIGLIGMSSGSLIPSTTKVVYLSSDLQLSTVAENYQLFWLDPSATELYCLNKKNQLTMVKNFAAAETTLLAEKVVQFVVNNECSEVYYLCSDKTLHCLSNGIHIEIATDLPLDTALYCNADGMFCYALSDGLYGNGFSCSFDGMKPSLLLTENRTLYLYTKLRLAIVKDNNILFISSTS